MDVLKVTDTTFSIGSPSALLTPEKPKGCSLLAGEGNIGG